MTNTQEVEEALDLARQAIPRAQGLDEERSESNISGQTSLSSLKDLTISHNTIIVTIRAKGVVNGVLTDIPGMRHHSLQEYLADIIVG
jgi:hypothetical protein